MKTKKLMPPNSAPVQRENAATVSRDDNAITPLASPRWMWWANLSDDDLEGII
jgi:prenylated cyclic peptide (anacyclamide/piricyclamide family)